MRSRLLPFLALFAVVASCEPTAPPGPSDPASETYAASLGVDISTMVKVDTNLYYKDITVGTGDPAAAFGKTIVVNYSGFLVDGTQFESNLEMDPDTIPLTYAINVITVWILVIPARMLPAIYFIFSRAACDDSSWDRHMRTAPRENPPRASRRSQPTRRSSSTSRFAR